MEDICKSARWGYRRAIYTRSRYDFAFGLHLAEPLLAVGRCPFMTSEVQERTGGCACGALQFVARGEPLRIGLCHCLICQKAHGAPYLAFTVFPRETVSVSGPHAEWESSPKYHRLYCPACGSRFANLAGEEIELPVACFDDASDLIPQYENWTIRRLAWIAPLAVPQFRRDREP